MASGVYNIFKYNCFGGNQDLEDDSPSDVIKVALMDNNHVFDATDNYWSDVSANELAESGNYTAGGEILSGQAITKAATTKFDAEDTVWSNATFTAYHAVVYDATTGELIASIDFGEAKIVASAPFTIQWNSSGIVTIAEA